MKPGEGRRVKPPYTVLERFRSWKEPLRHDDGNGNVG